MRSITALNAEVYGSIEGNLIGLLNVRYWNVAQGTWGIVRMKAMNAMRKSSNMSILIRGVFGVICSAENETRVANGAPRFIIPASVCSR